MRNASAARRTEIAKKAAATRRANIVEAARRSEAAKKAHVTRAMLRMARERAMELSNEEMWASR